MESLKLQRDLSQGRTWIPMHQISDLISVLGSDMIQDLVRWLRKLVLRKIPHQTQQLDVLPP